MTELQAYKYAIGKLFASVDNLEKEFERRRCDIGTADAIERIIALRETLWNELNGANVYDLKEPLAMAEGADYEQL